MSERFGRTPLSAQDAKKSKMNIFNVVLIIGGNGAKLAPAEFRRTKPDFKTAPMSTVNLKINRATAK